MPPAAAHGLGQQAADRNRAQPLFSVTVEVARHRGLVTDHQAFHETRGGDAREIRTTRGRGEGQRQTDQIVSRIADDALVQVADLHRHTAALVGQGSEVAQVAIAANPDRGTLGHIRRGVLQPFVKLGRAAAHVGMRGAGHLELLHRRQSGGPVCGSDHALAILHQIPGVGGAIPGGGRCSGFASHGRADFVALPGA